jgi:hypothetical protein
MALGLDKRITQIGGGCEKKEGKNSNANAKFWISGLR